jgi:hypothetical protein
MNNSRPDINHQQKMADTEHFLWCALIALHLSRIDGKTPSPLMEHIFLQNWLVTAKNRDVSLRLLQKTLTTLYNLAEIWGHQRS